MLYFASFCFAVCFALLCFALLCFALLLLWTDGRCPRPSPRFGLVRGLRPRFGLMGVVFLCFALLCFALLCVALLCFCFALLCFALALLGFALALLQLRRSPKHCRVSFEFVSSFFRVSVERFST